MPRRDQSAYIPVDDLSDEEKRSASLCITGIAIGMGVNDKTLSDVLMALGLKDYPEESSA